MFKILMIEDQPSYSSEISTVMRGFCQMHTTSSSAIGLNLANANRYDLIMIDVNMHADNTGLDTVQAITRAGNNSCIPIVAFSITKLLADKDFLSFHGFTHIISEPFNIRNFAQQIKFILSSQQKTNYFTNFLAEHEPLVPKISY
jgi:CheY-like chemotaxis protein